MLKRLKQKKERQIIAYMVEISQSQGPFLRPKLSQLGLGMAGLHAASAKMEDVGNWKCMVPLLDMVLLNALRH
jgi:hypothetical protein